MKKTSGLVPIMAYLYLSLPILIFFVGWCNSLTAIFGSLIILVSLFFAIKNAPKLWFPKDKKQILYVVAMFIIALIWVCFSGIGALVYQNPDHTCRNPIFELLVSNAWPVVHESEPAILTYYIAFWLPSAVVGKIFKSIQIGYYFQIIWATLGIFLFFYYIAAYFKKKNYLPIIIFIFFSGLDIVGLLIQTRFNFNIPITTHIEWWSPFQYSSFTTQLFWVFNQAIAAWLIVPVLMKEKNNKSIIFLYSCLFLYSTLPAIGIFPFIVYWCIKNSNKNFSVLNIKQAFLSILTFQNILGGLVVFFVSYLYLSSNISGGRIQIIPLNIFYSSFYFLFEAGIFLFILFKIYYKKPIYRLTFVCLLFYPLIVVGSSIDFCMRASIPPLVLLYLMVIRALDSKYFIKKFKIAYIVLILALSFGAVTPIHEFARTFVMTSIGVTKAPSDLGFDNFYGYTKNNKFLKYFGRKIDPKSI